MSLLPAMTASSEPPTLTTLPWKLFKMIIKKVVRIIKMIFNTGVQIINKIIRNNVSVPLSYPLTALPPDIIRKIITAGRMENETGMRLISSSWNKLVTDCRAKLPPIYSVSIGEIIDCLGVCVIVEDEHARFISSLLPDSRSVEPVQNHHQMLANKTRMSVEFPSNDTASISECLMRLFQNTNQIKLFRIVNFVNLDIIMKKIGRTEIETIELFHTCRQGRRINRNILTNIIERHSIYQVFIHDEEFHGTVIEDLLHNLPKSVKSFSVFVPNGSLANSSKDHWKSLAQDLVDNKGMRKVSIFESQERYDVSIRFCDYRDPIMQFMTTFACYFECSCYICMVDM